MVEWLLPLIVSWMLILKGILFFIQNYSFVVQLKLYIMDRHLLHTQTQQTLLSNLTQEDTLLVKIVHLMKSPPTCT